MTHMTDTAATHTTTTDAQDDAAFPAQLTAWLLVSAADVALTGLGLALGHTEGAPVTAAAVAALGVPAGLVLNYAGSWVAGVAMAAQGWRGALAVGALVRALAVLWNLAVLLF